MKYLPLRVSFPSLSNIDINKAPNESGLSKNVDSLYPQEPWVGMWQSALTLPARSASSEKGRRI